jgi:hypothetical protein
VVLAGGFEEGGAELGFTEGGVLKEALRIGVVKGLFFVGEWCRDGTEAFTDTGGTAGH